MSFVLIVSIAIRLAALGWSLVLVCRLRDGRMLFLSGLIALMALRQGLTLSGAEALETSLGRAALSELPGLAVSCLSVLAVTFLGRMLSEHASARDAQRRARSDLELVMDTVPQRLFWKDRQFRYLGCNQAFAEDAGLASPQEILGQDDFALAWKTTAPLYRADDRAVMEEDRARVGYEEPQELEDGSLRWLRTTKLPLRDRDGKVIGIFGSYEDVTKQKEAEAELLRSQEQLQHAQRLELVGRLAGGIAHDFNNLLLATTGHVELVLEDEGLAASHRQDLREALRAAARAAELTRQLLAFSRRQVIAPRRLRLDASLADMKPMLSRLVGESIRLELALGAPDLILRADPGQLQQVVMNLAINARDAMASGGSLRLSSRPSDSPEGRRGIEICVEDSGCGMSSELAAQVFEPFFTTKDAAHGTGLGLSVVHGIVHQAGGRITVESEPNRGSIFRIWVPAAEGPADEVAETREEDEAPAPGGDETVLILEDEAGVRRFTSRVLADRGYRVLVAADGAEAAALCRANRGNVDLLLADLVLPGESGSQVVAGLRPLVPGARILHVSGHLGGTGAGEASDETSEPILAKPYRPVELLRRVRQVLDA